MASISAVITDRLASFSIEITPVRLASALVDADLDGSVEYDANNAKAVKQVIVEVMSDLLAMPDVTEGGFSIKWDRAAVRAYVSKLQEWITPPISTTPTVTDKSYLW